MIKYLYFKYSNVSENSKNIINEYGMALTKKHCEKAFERLKERYLKIFQNEKSNRDLKKLQEAGLLLKNMGEMNFFEDAVKKALKKAAAKKDSSQDIVPERFNILEDFNKLDQYLKNLQKFLDQVADNEKLQKEVIVEILQEPLTRKAFRDSWLEKSNFQVKKEYKDQDLQYFLNTVAGNTALLNTYKNVDIKNEKNKNLANILQGAVDGNYTMLARVLGLMEESKLADPLKQYLDKEIQNIFNNKKVKVIVKKSGNLSGKNKYSYKKKTSDLELYLDFSEMLNGKPGQFTVKLPGVSVKKKFSKINNKIQLKSGAELEKLLHNSLYENKAAHLDALYHIFGLYNFNPTSYNKPMIDQKDRLTNFNVSNFTQHLKLLLFPTAIGGTLNKDDFAYFFVVNDKVFTIMDIFKKILTPSKIDSSIGIQPAIKSVIATTVARHQKNVVKRNVTREKILQRSRDTINFII